MHLIVESQYFPPFAAIKKLCCCTDGKIEQYEVFRKGTFRNRCLVLGANGVISLTVPIAGGREQKLVMRDIRIDYSEDWPRAHIRTLATSYNKSPFYQYYKSEVESLILAKPNFLIDLNVRILETIIRLLKVNVKLELTTEFTAQYDDALDYRSKLSPKNYQMSPEQLPRYAQVFEDKVGFQPNLSILDLLFCEGANSANLLNDHLT